MTKEFKSKWIEALRSNDYEQGTGYLKDNSEGSPKYCCLGVACDLLVKEGIAEEYLIDQDTSVAYFKLKGDNSKGDYEVLPISIAEYLNLSTNPIVNYKTNLGEPVIDTIADINDNGMTFKEIADIIEEQL